MSREFTEPPFVGYSRHRVVDGLLEILDDVNATNEPRWVSLEAPSGWGKTRVVQEFYARLASRQVSRYWPETIIGASDANGFEVGNRRKRVFPEPDYFDREPYSLPEFMWLGIACDLRNGVPSQTLLEDLQQLKTHAVYLEAAAAALKSVRKGLFPSLGQARSVLAEVIEEAAGEGLTRIVAEVANASVPGMGLVVKLGRWGGGRVAESRRQSGMIAAGGALQQSEDVEDLVESAAGMISDLAQPGLPVIVFVEDLHRVSDMTEELLERLIRSRSALMLITSTWPGELTSRKRLGPLLSEEVVCSRIFQLRHDQDSPPNFPVGASLAALPPSALADIVLFYYPNTDPRTLARLAARYNNPLPLELVCTMPKYQRHFPDGRLTLSEDEIDALPRRVEDLYRDLWEELPSAAQQVMALATLAIPENKADWHNPLTQAAIQTCEKLIDAAPIVDKLDQEVLPHGWVRSLTSWSRRFNEPDQYAIAKQSVEEYFFENQIDEFLTQLAVLATERDLAEYNAEDEHCSWLILSLHEKHKAADPDALRAIRCLQLALNKFPRELPTLVTLGNLLESLSIDQGNVELMTARSAFYSALENSGKSSQALTQFETLLADRKRVLGPDHPDVLTTRYDIAYCLANSGQLSQALTQFEALLVDQQRVLGPDHPDVLTTRHDIAYCLANSGQLSQALTQAEAVLADIQRLLGPDHQDVLTTRNNIAHWLGNSGQVSHALTQFEALLVDQQRVLGPDHPAVLSTRNSIAGWLGISGQVSQALTQFQALLVDRQRVLGPDHPAVLTTRNNVTSVLAEAGQVSHALTQFQALLVDRQRVLGPDHPDVLTTRNSIATWLGNSGQVSQALTQFQALLVDRQRVLGPDHPDVLTTRNSIATWLGNSGQVSQALTQFQALLVDQQRVLGPDHPDVLTTRNNIAYWLANSGQVSQALTQFQALLVDQQRVLGPDHPDVLTTRNNIAYWLANSGQVSQALMQFQALLVDQQRVLGPDHPAVLTTRNNVTSVLAGAGQVSHALTQFEALLVDQQRVLGPDHPDVLTTRNNIATWLANSGQVSQALTQSQALLVDRQRVLGPDHPDVLTTRNNIATWLANSGQVSQALTQFQALLVNQQRILGPDHPDVLTTRNNIACCLANSGQVLQALPQFEALLVDQTRVLGPYHPELVNTRRKIANLLGRSGES